MKAISLLITSVFLLSLGTGVLAQETKLPDPGLTPDSPFYFLETIAEGIGTFFTFGDLKKAERYADLAAERLAEVQAVVEKGKLKSVEKTLERYEKQLNNSIARAKKAMTKAKDAEKAMEVIAKVGKTTYIHLDVLAEVYEKVPEQAKPAVENAMKASLKGHEKAVEVLKSKNALGKVPEKVSVPAGVPQEVRERIQMKVQQGLMIEKALQGSELPRDLCIRMGGPSETCEKIPLKGFESFKEIENFCTEGGGPPEYCMTIESKCKEFGVTTPNECFRVISIATLETYQSAVLKTYPAPSLTEEEMKERKKIEEENKTLKLQIEGKIMEVSMEELSEEKFIETPMEELECKFDEVILYISSGCTPCERVEDEGTISKMEELGVKVTRIDTTVAPVKHELLGVPSFVINDKVHTGYKTFKELSELLGCQ